MGSHDHGAGIIATHKYGAHEYGIKTKRLNRFAPRSFADTHRGVVMQNMGEKKSRRSAGFL